MNGKTILVGVVVIIIVAIGGYFAYKNYAGTGAPAATNTGTPATGEQVQAQDVTVGTGAEATPGSVVSVLYVGKFSDGTVFDSSAAHGNEPLVFTLGAQGLIPGFQIGVNGMKVGGERVMAVPPSLGYGSADVKDPAGKVVIPANSTLIFNVKLVKVEAAGTTAPAPAQ
ncbi:MAG: FKBP-type peptidyl-prolyl cis-trans isomerase [Patescibacteria group bacterium]